MPVNAALAFASSLQECLNDSLTKLSRWVEQRDYKGYDPGDGLNSRLRPLALGNPLAERLLLQLIWKSPLNLRPLVGVKPTDSTKGRGYMAWGYLLRHRSRGRPEDLAKGLACLDWLTRNKAAGHVGYSWGNHFDFVTRRGRSRAGSPIIVWTSLIGQAFLEAFEQTGREDHLQVAREACRWVLQLPRERTAEGDCLSYVPHSQWSIHNANLLGAGLLARTWKHTRERELLEVARRAVQYSCRRQREDGSWWYAEEADYHWIDNFHTGYNLDSLKRYLDSTGELEFRDHYLRGLRYFRDVFFVEDSAAPRYYHDRTYPLDIQCAAQSIETLSFCSDDDPPCLGLACRVAQWTIAHMQDADGFFHYRRYPLLKAKTPYIHWGQATTFKALATLEEKLAGAPDGDAGAKQNVPEEATC
jgi:hypothetical protein